MGTIAQVDGDIAVFALVIVIIFLNGPIARLAGIEAKCADVIITAAAVVLPYFQFAVFGKR